MSDEINADVRKIAGDIVSAYLSNNQVAIDEVPGFIQKVMNAVSGGPAQEPEPQAVAPAVPIKKSIKDEAIVCLECGAQQKTMKRHLRVSHDLSPADYRTRWNLASDYPMVAPSYSKTRSAMAKKAGLGRRPGSEKSAS